MRLSIAPFLAAILAVTAFVLGAQAQTASNMSLSEQVTQRFFRSNLETHMYRTMWTGMENLLREARPDIPGQDLARAQFVVRDNVRKLYTEVSPPLVKAVEGVFNEDELRDLAEVSLSAETIGRFRASSLGEKFYNEGMTAAQKAINGPVLDAIKAHGTDFLRDTYMELVALKVAAPPKDGNGNADLPPEYRPVAPVPPIPMDRPKTQ